MVSRNILQKQYKKGRYFMLKKILDNLYCVYYRIYYILFGIRTINNPKNVNPPPESIPCQTEIDTEMRKHHNFLYAPVKPLKWTYWRRKFAFREIGTKQWFSAPKLTPWSNENGITKFGLNYTFVQKYVNKQLEFTTWI